MDGIDREVIYQHSLPPLLGAVDARPTDSVTAPRRERSISTQKLHPRRRGGPGPPARHAYEQRQLPTLQPQLKTFAGSHRAEALLRTDRPDDHFALPEARPHARRPCRCERRASACSSLQTSSHESRRRRARPTLLSLEEPCTRVAKALTRKCGRERDANPDADSRGPQLVIRVQVRGSGGSDPSGRDTAQAHPYGACRPSPMRRREAVPRGRPPLGKRSSRGPGCHRRRSKHLRARTNGAPQQHDAAVFAATHRY